MLNPYLAVMLVCAELQLDRGVVLEHLPGFAGLGWNYIGRKCGNSI